MAWAEKLPSGKYRGVYRDAQGVRRSAGTFTHKPRAEREAARIEAEVRESWTDRSAARRTWGEWSTEQWWPSRIVADSTRRRDTSRLKVYLEPRWSTVPLGAITRQDVKAWAADLLVGGTGASTVQRAVHLFSASLHAAVDAEILPANPAARIKLPKGGVEQERYLTREEYAAIREQLPTTDDQLVADLLVRTGLRWSELAGLHFSRVDLERGFVTVAETYDEETGLMRAYPKGKRARSVPLIPRLVDTLRDLPRGESCGCDHVSGRCRSGLVVTTPTGRPLRNSNWSEVWRDAVERSGVGHARVHDLRHTYASWLLQKGVRLAEVGRLLGHVSTTTTSKYAHLEETPSGAVLAALIDD